MISNNSYSCTYCKNDPGTKSKDSIVWKGFLDKDTNQIVCNHCKEHHYSIKFQNTELRGLYSEFPLTVTPESSDSTTVSGMKQLNLFK